MSIWPRFYVALSCCSTGIKSGPQRTSPGVLAGATRWEEGTSYSDSAFPGTGALSEVRVLRPSRHIPRGNGSQWRTQVIVRPFSSVLSAAVDQVSLNALVF